MIQIRAEKAAGLLATKHPWIFSGAVQQIEPGINDGDLVQVVAGNRPLGWGFYCASSKIALRMLSFDAAAPAADWLESRMAGAWQLRKSMRIKSDAFRLINAEGDFLPGLIVDIYGNTTVVRPLIKAMELLLERITAQLQVLLPENAIYLKRDEFTARKENISLENGYLFKTGDGKCRIEENGLNFLVDFARGQKTGYYLDQRDNRLLVRDLAAGHRVLNLFCYTGSFSLFAACGGAVSVVSVDSSAQALELAAGNLALAAQFPTGIFQWHKADVPDFLEREIDADLIILDPPPFARKHSELEGALKGYKFLNKKAIAKIAKNGLLFTFSCSGAVDKTAFRKLLFQAGRETGRNVRMIRELHAAADHPFALYHPEGEYLKGWLLNVE